MLGGGPSPLLLRLPRFPCECYRYQDSYHFEGHQDEFTCVHFSSFVVDSSDYVRVPGVCQRPAMLGTGRAADRQVLRV